MGLSKASTQVQKFRCQTCRASSAGDSKGAAREESLESSRRGGTAAAAALTRAHGGDLFGTWARRQKHFPQAPPPQPQPAECSRLADGSNGGDGLVDGELVNSAAAVAADAAGVTDSRLTANGRSERMQPVVAPHHRARQEAQDAAAAVQTEQDDDDRVRVSLQRSKSAARDRSGRQLGATQQAMQQPLDGRW